MVAPSDSLTKMEKILSPLVQRQQKRFICIVGSATSRHRSIREAITFISGSGDSSNSTNSHTLITLPDIVVIQDGARPIVDGDTLHQLVSNAFQFGATGVICPLTSTILKVKEVNSFEEIAGSDQKRFHHHQYLQPKWQLNSTLKRDNKYWASEMPQAFRYNLLYDAYNKVCDL